MTPAFPTQRDEVPKALELSIERHPDPDTDELSAADAIWPKRLRRIVRAALTYWRRPHLIDRAELLLCEMVTNALKHSTGPDIDVRLYIKDDRCVIEVNDGSPLRPKPRCANPNDENGRGLLIIDAVASEWGVSDDGTTTWCTLPLTEGPYDMEPAAVTASALREVTLELPANPSAVTHARIMGMTRLTMMSWRGNVNAGVDVLGWLVDNAVRYGFTSDRRPKTFTAYLALTPADELLIDVPDPNPTFPGFDKAVSGETGRSLWEAGRLGARLTWFADPSFKGKTVRATMRPGQVDL
jgi:hypothetical protein